MYESPIERLSDEQIEHFIDEALARGDVPFLEELVNEFEKRGHELEL